jgi:hypothetical protein
MTHQFTLLTLSLFIFSIGSRSPVLVRAEQLFPQQFLEMRTLHYQEMLQQEKAIDFYVELLRKDQLDENVQLDALEKVVNYFNSIYAVQFSSVVNGAALLTDHGKVLLASCCRLTALGPLGAFRQ